MASSAIPTVPRAIATHKEDLTPEEVEKRGAEFSLEIPSMPR